MASDSVNEALSSFGLSGKEIAIYVSTLELGSATANDIAEKSRLNRSTTYDILKSFRERGIASKVIKEKTAYFHVASPEKLIAMLEEKKDKLNGALKELNAIKQNPSASTSAQLYQGKEGFKTILDDILESRKDIRVISTSKVFDVMTYSFPYFIKRRVQLGIKSRVIQEVSMQTKELKKNDAKELRETRTIADWNVNSTTFIYGTKIAIVKLVKEDVIGVLIDDRAIHDDYEKIFNILWRGAS
jgi:sugar-specific transcriptional regulator TrmB